MVVMNEDCFCFLTNCIIKYDKENMRESQRFPQFLYNELSQVRPDIANAIAGTEYDFFYDEKLINEKWEYVHRIWA